VRTRTALHNLANQNTPGFKKYRVEFEELLQRAHAEGRHADQVVPQVVRDESGLPGVNNVSAIEETTTMAKVALLHDVFTRRAAGYFSTLDKAIRGQG
jgi:flagellar basal-body rod protein FlgB